MGIKRLLSRAVHTYRTEGVGSLLRKTQQWVEAKLRLVGAKLGFTEPYHGHKRTDSLERWEMIAARLDANDGSALDIGCASGYFTAQLARAGLFAIGIDRDTIKGKKRLAEARRLYGDNTGIAFAPYRVDPENIRSLPAVDVVTLLTVYHHWVAQNGRADAEEMLRVLASKTEKLFFEPPGGDFSSSSRYEKWPVAERPMEPDETAEEYYAMVLNRVFNGMVDIEYLGDAPYPASDSRTDPLFYLDCAEFQRPQPE